MYDPFLVEGGLAVNFHGRKGERIFRAEEGGDVASCESCLGDRKLPLNVACSGLYDTSYTRYVAGDSISLTVVVGDARDVSDFVDLGNGVNGSATITRGRCARGGAIAIYDEDSETEPSIFPYSRANRVTLAIVGMVIRSRDLYIKLLSPDCRSGS